MHDRVGPYPNELGAPLLRSALLERRSLNRLNVDTVRKNLREVALSAESNEGLGFRGRVGRLGEPSRVLDEGSGAEVWRYTVKVRLEKTDGRDAEGAKDRFKRVLAVVTRKAEKAGWTVLTPDPTPWRPGQERACW